MILTPEKVIPAKVEVTHDEFDIMCDYKVLLDNMIRAMEWKELNDVAGINKGWLQSLADGVQALLDMVMLLSEGV